MNDPTKRDSLRLAVADLSSRAESALSAWNAQLRDRTRPRPGATANTAAERIIAEDKLRLQLAELENETQQVEREFLAKSAALSSTDERAMIAQRHSDDVTAMEALEAHRHFADELQALSSELTILQALAQSCRDVLVGQEQRV